jgi:hypothetical protein
METIDDLRLAPFHAVATKRSFVLREFASKIEALASEPVDPRL